MIWIINSLLVHLPVIMSIIGPRETHNYRDYNLLVPGTTYFFFGCICNQTPQKQQNNKTSWHAYPICGAASRLQAPPEKSSPFRWRCSVARRVRLMRCFLGVWFLCGSVSIPPAIPPAFPSAHPPTLPPTLLRVPFTCHTHALNRRQSRLAACPYMTHPSIHAQARATSTAASSVTRRTTLTASPSDSYGSSSR